jgi:tRNA (mo5U34)-methyltransferase
MRRTCGGSGRTLLMRADRITFMTDEELLLEMGKLDWWHSIPLRPGITTPGKSHNLFVEQIMSLPDDLHGKSVLDIGAWDGGYSFLCERRGAERVVVGGQ